MYPEFVSKLLPNCRFTMLQVVFIFISIFTASQLHSFTKVWMKEISKNGSYSGSRKYDHWGYLASVTSKTGVDSISALSRSQRCFQIEDPVGEQLYSQNFYSGTSNFTPGPGTYQGDVSLKTAIYQRPKTSIFGQTSSKRLLLQSDRMWTMPTKDQSPGPASYNVLPSTTEEHLKSILGVSIWRLKILKEKDKEKDILPPDKRRTIEREMQEEYKPLLKKIKDIKAALRNIEEEKTKHIPTFPAPLKPGFASSAKKWYEHPTKVQKSPTFYTSQARWDFGSDSRSRTIDMSAFQYAERVDKELAEEFSTDLSVATGIQRRKSRCRTTEFFGDITERLNSPPVGAYHPDILPALKKAEKNKPTRKVR
eukprot:gene10029-20887_t